MVFEKFSACYIEFEWKLQLRKILERLEQKLDSLSLIRLQEICCWSFLMQRKTVSILSFGYHRLWLAF